MIIYALGTVVVFLKERRIRREIDVMVREHNAEIKKIQKHYDIARKKFSKKSRKIQRILTKARGA